MLKTYHLILRENMLPYQFNQQLKLNIGTIQQGGSK